MSVTIHTTNGDIKAEIFCDTTPRTAFNFLALAAAGKFDGTIFHRNIRGFMIQGGDTAHVTGKKSSIWGDEVTFPDEFHPNNKHDRRGRLVSPTFSCRLHYALDARYFSSTVPILVDIINRAWLTEDPTRTSRSFSSCMSLNPTSTTCIRSLDKCWMALIRLTSGNVSP